MKLSFRYRWFLFLLLVLPMGSCASIRNTDSSPQPSNPTVETPVSVERERKARKPQPEVNPVESRQTEADKNISKKLGQTSKPAEDILLPPAPLKPPAVGGSGG